MPAIVSGCAAFDARLAVPDGMVPSELPAFLRGIGVHAAATEAVHLSALADELGLVSTTARARLS